MKALLPIRILAWALALGLLSLPLVGLFTGWFAADHWPVRSLKVEGNFQHVPAQQVREQVAHLLKPGFFAVDLGDIRAATAALPWVDRVEVRKFWPDQILIRVVEHKAFARWNDDSLIDYRGQAFAVPDAADLTHLPRLAGPEGEATEVLGFYLDARKQLAAVGLDAAGVRHSRRGTWEIELDSGAVVTVGKNNPAARLLRFSTAYAQLARPGRPALASADLRYSNGFAVRWAEPQADEDGGPPPA